MSDRFDLLEELARDDVSVVSRAFDRSLHREVVLKRLLPEAQKDEKLVARLVREARAVAQIRTPRVLSIYEVGEDGDGPFLCIEPARGESLAAHVKRLAPLSSDEVVEIGVDLCEALTAVHRARIVHRNVGLDQIFFDDTGHVRLTGFALAKQVPGGPRIVTTIGQTSTLITVPRASKRPYAPEEAFGSPLEPRSDLFALAVVLVDCLAGTGPDSPAAASGSPFREARSLRALRPDLSGKLEAVLQKALALVPDQRYASAADFAAALRDAVPPPRTAPDPPTVLESVRLPVKGSPLTRATSIAGAVVAVIVLGIWTVERLRDGPGSTSRGASAVAAASPSDYQPNYAGSHALIVGIDQYADPAWPKLAHAIADARAMRDYLVNELVENEGFPAENVTLLEGPDATRQRIVHYLRDDCADVGKVGRNDRVLFFFAGHGQQQATPNGPKEKTGYIVPFDGTTHDRAGLITHEEIVNARGAISAKHVLFLLDCCFSGWAATREGDPKSADVSEALTATACQIIAAGKPGEPVGDELRDSPDHSPFTHFLLDGLRGAAAFPGRDFVTAFDLDGFIRNKVVEATRHDGRRQTPVFSNEGTGDFVFHPKALQRSGPAAAPETGHR